LRRDAHDQPARHGVPHRRAPVAARGALAGARTPWWRGSTRRPPGARTDPPATRRCRRRSTRAEHSAEYSSSRTCAPRRASRRGTSAVHGAVGRRDRGISPRCVAKQRPLEGRQVERQHPVVRGVGMPPVPDEEQLAGVKVERRAVPGVDDRGRASPSIRRRTARAARAACRRLSSHSSSSYWDLGPLRRGRRRGGGRYRETKREQGSDDDSHAFETSHRAGSASVSK
jgi:hypothetical protein